MVALSLLLIGGLLGCSGDEGPNDPGMTSAQIQKIRAAAVKPSDGVAPPPAGGGGKRK